MLPPFPIGSEVPHSPPNNVLSNSPQTPHHRINPAEPQITGDHDTLQEFFGLNKKGESGA